MDIGAFESQGFTLTPVTGSTPQGTPVNSPFANPLAVIVTANNPLEPVAGGMVTFSAPASGASANLNTTSPVTIGSNGQASVTATANAIVDQYTVSASTTGAATPASFVLTNQVNPAPSAVIVTTLADDPSGSIPGYTTLRDAITEANTGPTRSVEITFAVTGTIDLTSVLPDLANNITIQGSGASDLTVQRDSTAVGFSVFTVNSGETVNISGMTITGGDSSAYGGGICNLGTLTVDNSVLTNNSAYSYGGGIYNNGTLTVTSSTFVDNNSVTADGGGICNYWDGVLTVTNSTFANNYVTFAGGGICSFGTATVINSTLTGNDTGGGATGSGGIYCYGTLTVTNSTIANNIGDGICNGVSYSFAILTLNNTIIAGNNLDIYGPLQPTSSNNLIGNGTGITNLSDLNSSNLIGTTAEPINPLLGPLANNGGPTQTMALLPGSPAIAAGSVTLAVDANGNPLTTDQRGLARITTASSTSAPSSRVGSPSPSLREAASQQAYSQPSPPRWS